MEVLRVSQCCRIYGHGSLAVRALDHVSFQVRRGEFIAIIGPSGSGKSTLMHILGGVDRPDQGQVIVEGTEITSLNETQLAVFRRRQVGLIYQFYNLIPVLTVQENIMLPLLLDGRRPDPATVEALLEQLGLTKQRNLLPSQLSGGQQQRVSIGRALIHQPAILLADEPTGNLDSRNSQQVMTMLRRANRQRNQTCVVITHDENIALQADRILVLEDGRIVKDEVLRR